MKKRSVLLLALILAAVIFLNQPRLRAELFVTCHSRELEEAIQAGSGIPAVPGVKTFNTWPGESPMTEFILTRRGLGSGSRYYGCYYSPEDVPLAFQNAKIPLTPQAGRWVWQGEGDNRGSTARIRPGWYYFEASF